MSEGAETAVTSLLKRYDPLWWWLRENFKLPSIITIAGCLLTSAAWLYTQHTDLTLQQKRDPEPHLQVIEAQLSEVLQAQSAMKQQLADFGQRIDRQDQKWQRAEEAAEIRIPGRRH